MVDSTFINIRLKIITGDIVGSYYILNAQNIIVGRSEGMTVRRKSIEVIIGPYKYNVLPKKGRFYDVVSHDEVVAILKLKVGCRGAVMQYKSGSKFELRYKAFESMYDIFFINKKIGQVFCGGQKNMDIEIALTEEFAPNEFVCLAILLAYKLRTGFTPKF